jgi:hypothetical protein
MGRRCGVGASVRMRAQAEMRLSPGHKHISAPSEYLSTCGR